MHQKQRGAIPSLGLEAGSSLCLICDMLVLICSAIPTSWFWKGRPTGAGFVHNSNSSDKFRKQHIPVVLYQSKEFQGFLYSITFQQSPTSTHVWTIVTIVIMGVPRSSWFHDFTVCLMVNVEMLKWLTVGITVHHRKPRNSGRLSALHRHQTGEDDTPCRLEPNPWVVTCTNWNKYI